MDNITINLNDLMENMEQLAEDAKIYLSKKDGDFYYITGYIMEVAEKGNRILDIEEWEQESLDIANDILKNGSEYILVPNIESVKEEDIIKDYINTIKEEEINKKFKDAINSKEGSRKFKNLLVDLDMYSNWDEYIENYYKNLAIKWCEENKINFQ